MNSVSKLCEELEVANERLRQGICNSELGTEPVVKWTRVPDCSQYLPKTDDR